MPGFRRTHLIAALPLAAALSAPPIPAAAQSLRDLKAAAEPLVLQQQGSFFVGGRSISNPATGWNEISPKLFGGPRGDVMVDQMYVQFQKPLNPERHVPVVFVHGCCLSSKTWETTPDGRMGWYEYFTRRGYPTYLAEQSGRARSGFNTVGFNEVRLGQNPPASQPLVLMATAQFAWPIFRFGPKFGEPWPDQQFPMERVDELYKQVIPDLIMTQVPDLLRRVRKPHNDLAHGRQHGRAGAGARRRRPRRPLAVERLPDEGRAEGKARHPRHRAARDRVFPEARCRADRDPCKGAIARRRGRPLRHAAAAARMRGPEMEAVNKAGGDMTFIALPSLGMKGNSHMFMQDRNNLPGRRRDPEMDRRARRATRSLRAAEDSRTTARRRIRVIDCAFARATTSRGGATAA